MKQIKTMKSIIIKIQNLYIDIMFEILAGFVLDEKQSCTRRRFLRTFKPVRTDLEEARKDIQIKYCTKNDKGEPIIEDDKYKFTSENRKKFSKSWEELNNQFVMVDVLPSNIQDLNTISIIFKQQAAKFIEEKKNEFNAVDYDYIATINELLEMLVPFKEDKKNKKNK